jgi:mannose-6-phosphate isomerase-like protein (cupin superfamily)
MRIRSEADCEIEVWRDGVKTRMYASATTGAHQLCVFEQWCAPGHGAPSHVHAVEEVLRVVAGEAEVWVGDGRQQVAAGVSVLIPAGAVHGFRNTGDGVLQMLAILAEPIFEARYLDPERDVRRWSPRSETAPS